MRRYKLWLKAKLLQGRQRFVRAFRSYDQRQLLAALREVGVGAGDSVMLHSAFNPSHGFRGSIEQLTDAFIEAIGPEGHLLMVSLPYRTATVDYLQTYRTFDVRKTPSMMGLVSELFRRRPDVVRSLHPTHPVLVRGPRAEWFVEAHPECLYPCGPGSPFDRLAAADGKAVFFNVPVETYTFFHYLEHLVSGSLPFSLYTSTAFHLPVVDRSGQTRQMETHAFAREAIKRRRFSILESTLRARGLIRQCRVGATRIEALRVRDSVACVLEMAAQGKYFYDLSPGPTGLEGHGPPATKDMEPASMP